MKAFWRLHNNNNKWILHNTRNPFASAWAPKPVASALRDVLRRDFFASHCSRHQIVVAPGPTNQTDESQAEQMRKTNAERVKQTEGAHGEQTEENSAVQTITPRMSLCSACRCC